MAVLGARLSINSAWNWILAKPTCAVCRLASNAKLHRRAQHRRNFFYRSLKASFRRPLLWLRWWADFERIWCRSTCVAKKNLIDRMCVCVCAWTLERVCYSWRGFVTVCSEMYVRVDFFRMILALSYTTASYTAIHIKIKSLHIDS